jgi:lysophospholipase L1-like esterase
MILALLLTLASRSHGLSVAPGLDQFGRASDVVSWADSGGQTRSVWIVHATPGAFISKMTYMAAGSLVTAQAPSTGFAFCTLVNHHIDNYGGAFTSSEGLSNPPSLYNGGSTYAVSLTASVAFAGAHHLVWDGSFQMYAHPWETTPTASAADVWYITIQYCFVDGRDDFIFSNAYDSGAMPQSTMNSTNLAPYCDFNFDGQGSPETSSISGIGIGTLYKFLATGGPLTDTSPWTYSAPNTIPYAWMFKDATLDDRELGAVQNQPYLEKDAGCNFYLAGTFPYPPYNSTPGQLLPNSSSGTAYLLPFQMNSEANYAGERFTWGTPYTAFQNSHTDGLNTKSSWNVYPINASSFSMLIDSYSSGGVPALVSDTANLYASSLGAIQGSVVTSGPQGPGNYVSLQTGSMPSITYTHPGFDFVVRAWRFNAAAGGNAAMSLNAGGPLDKPTFIINQFPSPSPCAVRLDGATQAQGADYEASYNPSTLQLYLTFLKTLPQGSRLIEVDSNCGSPSPSPTASPTCSATPSSTQVPAGSSPTPTPLPTAACTSNPFPLLLKPNQRIFFVGDSITFRGNYTKQVQNYLNTLYPGYHLSFTNVGVGGWTATNFLQYSGPIPTGLNYVVAQHPDIATICFGMNDAGYVPFSASNFNTFVASMTQIVSTLTGAGIQVVLLSPGMVDQSVPYASNPSNIPSDYNTTLGTYAQWVLNFASARGIPAYDIHTLAMSVNAAAKAAHPGLPAYTDQPQDGIHPNPSGGLVYAYGLLSALGLPYQCRSISLDLGAGTATGSTGAAVSGYLAQGNGCSFSLVADPLPYVGNPQSAKILPFLNFQQEFNNIQLRVSGLSAASYAILVDGYRGPTLSSASLASGVNLLDSWIPPSGSPGQAHAIQLVDASQFTGPSCYASLIDDMQSSNNFPASPNNIDWPENLWGGLWYGGSGNGGASSSFPNPLTMSATGYNNALAANLSGTTNINTNLQLLLTYCYTQYDSPKDGVEFWFKGNANQPFRFQAHIEFEDAQNPPLYTDYGYNFTPSDGNWHLYDIPFSSLSQPSWASGNQVFSFDPGQITTLEWLPYFTGTFSMSVDNLSFYCAGGTPTPSLTPSPCPACHASPSPSASKTASLSPSPTATLSRTQTPTSTLSPTSSSTLTPLPSPTSTMLASPTFTKTATPLPSPSPSRTATQAPSATASPSWTSSPSSTMSPTASPSFTQVPMGSTPSWTPTSSPTTTMSYSPSVTPSLTPSSSPSPTSRVSLTPSATAWPSITASPTVTARPTGSATPTTIPTATGSPSPRPSPSATPPTRPSLSCSPSLSGTPTLSPGPDRTQTATPSPTMVQASPSPSYQASSSQIASPGPTGPIQILQHAPVPNPNPSCIAFKLAASVDQVELSIFTVGMNCLGRFQSGPHDAGWCRLDLPESLVLGASNGMYYYTLVATRDGVSSLPMIPGKFMLLR